MENTTVKEWITPLEFHKEFGICISTQNKMRMAKKIPYSKIGQKVFYNREKINKWFHDAEVA